VDLGYLAVETHRDRPGRVRLLLLSDLPEVAADDAKPTQIRYAARFNDRDAALMHAHEIFKRRLLDPDSRLYRVEPEDAIGAIESLGLPHRDVYLDPGFDAASRARIDAAHGRITRQRERWDKFFQTIGYIAIGILLLNFFVLSLA
jgi:hypothetical protein